LIPPALALISMGYFSKLFGRPQFESLVIEDDYLGRISNDRHGSWSGAMTFATLDRQIDVTLRTGTQSPSEADKQFLREIEERYAFLWAMLRAKAFEGLEAFADGTTPEALFESLEPQHIAIWEPVGRPRRWEISAITTKMEGAIFRFQFAEFEYQDFGMDD
jgi:hypothetical protein